mgnify:CR=1 FL=1
MIREVDYTHFAQNKFKSLSITLRYNVLLIITFDYALHTCSTKPNPCTNFSHSHSVHSQLWHSLVNLLNGQTCNSHRYYMETLHVFCLIDHIWPLKSDNKIYCSLILYFSLSLKHTMYTYTLTYLLHTFRCANTPYLFNMFMLFFIPYHVSLSPPFTYVSIYK